MTQTQTQTLTLEYIEERQAELARLIEQFKTQKQNGTLYIPETKIVLQPGERYAGTVLDDKGLIQYHLVLMAARPDGDLIWGDAMAWADEVGGHLPDRQEQALLYANCKPHLKPVWHWSCEEHEDDASCAWYCDFASGYQTICLKSAEGAAVAVRRIY